MPRPKKQVEAVKLEDAAKELEAVESAPAPTSSALRPIIKVVGENHPWEDMEVDGVMPTIKAVGYSKLSKTSRDYVSYVATIKNGKLESLDVSEPNLKAIAADDAKTSFVSTFMNDDGILE